MMFTGCKKIESGGSYSVKFDDPKFYYSYDNESITIPVAAEPSGKVNYAIVRFGGSYYDDTKDYLVVSETSNSEITLTLLKPAYGFGIVTYLFSEGEIKSTDTCWFGGIADFEFSGKIYFDERSDDVIKSYDIETNITNKLTADNNNSYLFGVFPEQERFMYEQSYTDGYVLNDLGTGIETIVQANGGSRPSNIGGHVFSTDGFYQYSSNNLYTLVPNTGNSSWANLLSTVDYQTDVDVALRGSDTITVYSTSGGWSVGNRLYLQVNSTILELDSVGSYNYLQNISISENTDYVYYLNDYGGNDYIYRAKLSSPYTIDKVTSVAESIYLLDSSPDGTKVAFLDKNANLKTIDVGTNITTTLIQNLNTSKILWK